MSDVLELVINYRLKSANAHARRHWSYWHRETMVWQALLAVAMTRHKQPIDIGTWSVIVRTEMQMDERGVYQPYEVRRLERRRVSVIRVVGSRGHFCTDDDNLKFSLKPLLDAMKRIGLITDDKREYLDQPSLPEQRVDQDRVAKTIVRIERISTEGQTCRMRISKSAGTARSGATTTRRPRRPRPSRRRRA